MYSTLRARRRRAMCRPILERLEDRTLPAFSSLVYPGGGGNLLYTPDNQANRVEDFSMVGYRTGVVPLPGTPGGVTVPVQVSLNPTGGDQTGAIQAAINQVSQLPLDANGFRGAVFLNPGVYDVSGSLQIQASGVVLEGAANDPNTGTVLDATGTAQRLLIQVSGSGSRQTVAGTTHNVIDPYVPVGAIGFHVDSTAGLSVGDTVVVHRPSPANWIHDIGMDLLQNPWQPNSKNLDWDRIITRIEGNVITLDAPLTNSLDQQYGGGTIYKYTWPGRLENAGVANLYAVSDSVSSTDENHATGVLQMDKAENSWVYNVTGEGFAQNFYILGGGTKWVTLDQVQARDTSITTGAPPSGFLLGGQLTLVQNAYVHNGYHAFAFNSTVPGPNVIVDSSADGRGSESGPHQRWSTGGLFDNVLISGTNLAIRNAGNEGTGHGWQGANYVLWNSTTDRTLNVNSPPTAQNWVIGSSAATQQGNAIFDSWGTAVEPRSLYYEQLNERESTPGVSKREYWLGDMDNFMNPNDDPYVDPTWYDTVSGALGTGQIVTHFDDPTPNTWVPFSFQFPLAPGEQVVGASLSLGVQRTAGNVGDDDSTLYLNSLANSASFGALGWLPLGYGSTSGVVLDLSGQLGQLQSGLLNMAVAGNAGVDWAVLDIRVAPTQSATRVSLSGSFNRVGIAHDGTLFSGGLDGSGYAYSADRLGATVTAGGAVFGLGTPNDFSAVSATGQTVALPAGQFSTLAFLGTATHGSQLNQTFVVTYTDGTSTTFTQSLSDWLHPQAYAGEATAAAIGYRDKHDGTQGLNTTYLYLYRFTLDRTRVVNSITLPNNADVEVLAMDLLP
jgi:hypothetical protein